MTGHTLRIKSISTTLVKSTTNTNTNIVSENFQDRNVNDKVYVVPPMIDSRTVDETDGNVYRKSSSIDMYPTSTQQTGAEMTEDINSTQENGDEITEDTNVNDRDNVVLSAAPSIMMDDMEGSEAVMIVSHHQLRYIL